MNQPRFYVECPLSVGQQLPLPPDAAHHANHVLRLTVGDAVCLFNGEGGEYLGCLTECGKRQTIVQLNDHYSLDRAAPVYAHLGLCILKREAMTAALARVTELGACTITPLFSAYCTVPEKTARKRLEHWRKTVIAACEQCGLNKLPIVNEPCALSDWVGAARAKHVIGYIALPEEVSIKPETADCDFHLLVGPEGGFAAEEAHQAVAAGFEPISLGDRTLRAETAPLVALAMLMPLI